MSLKNWHDNGWLDVHKTSPQEIKDLLAVAERDLKDSSAAGRISQREADEMKKLAMDLYERIVTWLHQNHANLMKK
jgi:hypothetical protein